MSGKPPQPGCLQSRKLCRATARRRPKIGKIALNPHRTKIIAPASRHPPTTHQARAMSSASSAAPNPDAAFTPAQILQALMVSCIYPLLQNKRTGPIDPAIAHAAAIEVLKSFHIHDTWELFVYTQAI